MKSQKMKTMKNFKFILFSLVAAMVGFTACENQSIEFDDFGSTTCYFPYQYPARSLILGKYDLGINDNDNNHQFEIGVTMSGVYQNNMDRVVYYELDETLLSSVTNVTALPGSYYSIETESPVIIPAGSTKGRIIVKLTEAFFNDPKSLAPQDSVCYVIPIKITGVESLDSVLRGKAADGVNNPDPNSADDWAILPKDFTLYGIKFINKFHGNYLRRGTDKLDTFNVVNNTYNNKITTVYHSEFVEQDEVVMLTATSLNSIVYSSMIRRGELQSPGDIELMITFDENNICKVFEKSSMEEIGSGKFAENSDSWGGTKKDVMWLEYSYLDSLNNEMHQVFDTLVIRDRAVVFEEFTVKLDSE